MHSQVHWLLATQPGTVAPLPFAQSPAGAASWRATLQTLKPSPRVGSMAADQRVLLGQQAAGWQHSFPCEMSPEQCFRQALSAV